MNEINCNFRLLVVFLFLLLCNLEIRGQLSTQIGIGTLFINGDVDPVIDPLNSFHVGINKNIKPNVNLEFKLGISKTLGLSGTYMTADENVGGLIEDVFSSYKNGRVWYPNHLTTYAYGDIGINYILNTGIERLRFIGGGGLGVSISSTNINLYRTRDDNQVIYTLQLPESTDLESAKDQIDRNYDSSYETKFEPGGGIVPHLSLQIGVQFRITRGIFFSADARYHLTAADYLDPIKNISAAVDSGNKDSVSMFTIGFVGYLLADEGEDRGPVK